MSAAISPAPCLLAVDVGGTATRAVLITPAGECLGFGASAGGNPTSAGPERATAAIVAATEAALSGAGLALTDVATVVAGIAGASGRPGQLLRDGLRREGWAMPISFRADLLGMYCSGALEPDGYALVAGTGAVASLVRGGELVRLRDGLGWLLGDDGSGFWIGHRAVRAVVADLDDRGPATAMTGALLAHLGIEPSESVTDLGQSRPLRDTIEELYRLVPVELARFAPLAFDAAAAGDVVAVGIVDGAAAALADTLRHVLAPDVDGPLVLGGSVLARQPTVAARVVQEFRAAGCTSPVITVDDGVAGAAVLALREFGVDPDPELFARLHTTLRAKRDER